MQLTTSLRLCRKHGACGYQYPLLVAALGPDWGEDQPIPLTLLLDLDGTPGWQTVSNTLWALRTVPAEQAEARDRVAASYCVEALGGIPGPPEHTHAVQVLRAFAAGKASVEEVSEAAREAREARLVWAARLATAAWLARLARLAWLAWEAREAREALAASEARETGEAWDHKSRSILRWLLEEETARDD
jgi:hypothetical protein